MDEELAIGRYQMYMIVVDFLVGGDDVLVLLLLLVLIRPRIVRRVVLLFCQFSLL
jgi:hypothetical protein